MLTLRKLQNDGHSVALKSKPHPSQKTVAVLPGRKPTLFFQFLHEEEGQTLVEYGLLISLIALVVIAVLTLLGSHVKNTFNTAANNIKTTTS